MYRLFDVVVRLVMVETCASTMCVTATRVSIIFFLANDNGHETKNYLAFDQSPCIEDHFYYSMNCVNCKKM